MQNNTDTRWFVAGTTPLIEYLKTHSVVSNVSNDKNGKLKEYDIFGTDRHISINHDTIYLVDKSDIVVVDTLPKETKIKKVIEYSGGVISAKRLEEFIKRQ